MSVAFGSKNLGIISKSVYFDKEIIPEFEKLYIFKYNLISLLIYDNNNYKLEEIELTKKVKKYLDKKGFSNSEKEAKSIIESFKKTKTSCFSLLCCKSQPSKHPIDIEGYEVVGTRPGLRFTLFTRDLKISIDDIKNYNENRVMLKDDFKSVLIYRLISEFSNIDKECSDGGAKIEENIELCNLNDKTVDNTSPVRDKNNSYPSQRLKTPFSTLPVSKSSDVVFPIQVNFENEVKSTDKVAFIHTRKESQLVSFSQPQTGPGQILQYLTYLNSSS